MTVDEAVWSAVIYLNNGNSSVKRVYEKLGIAIWSMSAESLEDADNRREKDAARMSWDTSKKRRKIIRAIRKGFQDTTKDKEGDVYNLGGH